MKILLLLLAVLIFSFDTFAQREIRITTIKGVDTTIIKLDDQLGKLGSIIELTMIKMMDDSTLDKINKKFELIIDTIIKQVRCTKDQKFIKTFPIIAC